MTESSRLLFIKMRVSVMAFGVLSECSGQAVSHELASRLGVTCTSAGYLSCPDIDNKARRQDVATHNVSAQQG